MFVCYLCLTEPRVQHPPAETRRRKTARNTNETGVCVYECECNSVCVHVYTSMAYYICQRVQFKTRVHFSENSIPQCTVLNLTSIIKVLSETYSHCPEIATGTEITLHNFIQFFLNMYLCRTNVHVCGECLS